VEANIKPRRQPFPTVGDSPIANRTLDIVTAGHADTPLAKKLGIKAGYRVRLIGGPPNWSIQDLPDNVHVSQRRGSSPANVVVAFFHDTASLEQRIGVLSGSITVDGALWIAWPRKAAGHASDITDNIVRNKVLPHGLVDIKVAAIDEDWSALKFVWRKQLRLGLA
jgi:hypothetical protein